MNYLSSIHFEVVNVYHFQKKIFIETEKEDITEQFHQFKNDFLDEFNEFKTKFLHEAKSFKDNILDTTQKKHRKPGTYSHIIIR